jgi:hypothetical protein
MDIMPPGAAVFCKRFLASLFIVTGQTSLPVAGTCAAYESGYGGKCHDADFHEQLRNAAS